MHARTARTRACGAAQAGGVNRASTEATNASSRTKGLSRRAHSAAGSCVWQRGARQQVRAHAHVQKKHYTRLYSACARPGLLRCGRRRAAATHLTATARHTRPAGAATKQQAAKQTHSSACNNAAWRLASYHKATQQQGNDAHDPAATSSPGHLTAGERAAAGMHTCV